MRQGSLAYKNSTINYYSFGRGPGTMICFHGYGEDATSYTFLDKYAGDKFHFYAIDLPYHGKTDWKERLNFSHTDLLQIVDTILQENNQQPETSNLQPTTGSHQLSLLGFSLGGRIALSLYQAQPRRVEKLILLAPDGLKVNFWYWLATQTWAGNRLFAFSMKYPAWFFAFLKGLNKLGLVNTSVFKFVNYYIGNREARELLYQRWTGLRKLRPNLDRIKGLIRQHKTFARLVYGKYDRIILPVRGEKFQKGIEEYCELTIINSGHQVLHENHVEGIMQALKT